MKTINFINEGSTLVFKIKKIMIYLLELLL